MKMIADQNNRYTVGYNLNRIVKHRNEDKIKAKLTLCDDDAGHELTQPIIYCNYEVKRNS